MALVTAMMAMTLLTALGSAVIISTITETAIAASYRHGSELFYAADGAADFAIQELAAMADWDDLAAGDTLQSYRPFVHLISPDAPPVWPYVTVSVVDVTAAEVRILATAYGPTGGQRSVGITVSRSTAVEDGASDVRVLLWQEVR